MCLWKTWFSVFVFLRFISLFLHEYSDNEPFTICMKNHFNTELYFQTKHVQKRWLFDKKYIMEISLIWIFYLNVPAMRMNVFINPISKIYLGTKVDSGLFHTTHFVSYNNKLLKEKLNRHCHNLFKMHMIKLHPLWLFRDRNINIEKHLPDVKIIFIEDINFKELFYVSNIFHPIHITTGRNNSYNTPRLNFQSKQRTPQHLSAILKGCNRDFSEASGLWQKIQQQTIFGKVSTFFPSNPRKCIQYNRISAVLTPSSILTVIWKSNNENVARRSIWEKHMSHCGFAKSSLYRIGSF